MTESGESAGRIPYPKHDPLPDELYSELGTTREEVQGVRLAKAEAAIQRVWDLCERHVGDVITTSAVKAALDGEQ